LFTRPAQVAAIAITQPSATTNAAIAESGSVDPESVFDRVLQALGQFADLPDARTAGAQLAGNPRIAGPLGCAFGWVIDFKSVFWAPRSNEAPTTLKN
jgi:hypothetical protein